ncbi:MAG: hypothetical protein QNJ23_06735 [Woeseiaceae bacterium]|nr:hypothetical protein [Woeseiaceae bacterium]
MNETPRKSGRLQLLLMAAVFFGPLLVAAWLYYGDGAMQPAGRSNHGVLLDPFVGLDDELPGSAVAEHYDQTWVLLHMNIAGCNEPCREALYTYRQVRLMLGKEMERVQRVFLHGETPPDTLFLAEEHPGLITIEDSGLAGLLSKKRPADVPAGGYFLIDPHGNLVMYFHPGLDPAEMVDDIKHLLRLSRIG